MSDAPHGPMVFGVDGTAGGGGPPLCDLAPVAVLPDNVAAPGASTDASRCDHTHRLPVDAPVGTGVANAVGSANAVSRADHVHLTNLAVRDEGVPGGDAHTLDVVGAGASVAVVAGVATLTIPGGGAGLGAPVEIVGTTANPTAPVGGYATIPQMTIGFTPTGTRAWVNFQCSTRFAPSGTGAEIVADFRINVDAVPVPGSDYEAGFQGDLLIGLFPGYVAQVVTFRQLVTGLTPGVPITVDVAWREQPGATSGVVTALGTKRALTVEDSP